MKKFRYKAWDENYNIVKGTVDEEEINSAKELVKSKGLNIISITEYKSLDNLLMFNKKLSDSKISEFCGQMAIIINSGVNILKGIEVLEMQMDNKKMKKVLKDVKTGVQRGRTLGKSMEDTAAFPKLLCDMVTSGEISGDIDTVLFNMEGFYEKEANIKSKIITASIYPAVLLLVAFGMVMFFNFFIFGELKDMFSDTKNLPFITKALFAFMNFFNSNLPYIIAGIFLLIILLKYLKTLNSVRYVLDLISLNNPITKKVRIYMITSRFTRSMAIFLKSSVPILSSLDSVKMIVDNLYIASKIEKVKTEMVNGSSIAEAFEKQNFFEPLVVQMMRVGEESGKLEETLQRLAEVYDKKSDSAVGKLMAMIEPAFTIIIGIFIGTIILAIALPVMSMSTTLK